MGFSKGAGLHCVDCCDAIRSFKGVTIPCVDLISGVWTGGVDRYSAEHEISVESSRVNLAIQVSFADH